MSELSDAELLRLSDEWKSGKPFAFEDIDRMALALPRLIARAQKAETDCTDLVGAAYHKGYHEGYRAAIQSQEKPG